MDTEFGISLTHDARTASLFDLGDLGKAPEPPEPRRERAAVYAARRQSRVVPIHADAG